MTSLYLHELANARAELLRVYHRISDPDARTSDQSWSAREILHHLYLSENGIARIFSSAERVCESADAYSDELLERERDGLSTFLSNREQKVDAPARIQPVDLSAEHDVVQELSVSRDLLVSAAGSLRDEQLRSLFFVHPLRSKLSLYGWLWFVARHERRHIEQIRALLSHQTDGMP